MIAYRSLYALKRTMWWQDIFRPRWDPEYKLEYMNYLSTKTMPSL